jgi:hypothetical protein
MSSEIIWVPVTELLSSVLIALGPRYIFDWNEQVWVEHQKGIDLKESQFWIEVVPATARFLAKVGLRNKHLLKAMEPIPPWPSKVVLLYMGTQIAAALVDVQPGQSEAPPWWFPDPYPTRFERESVI